jgi:Tfp pilus assembly protein PilO
VEITKFSQRVGNFDAKIPVGRSHGEFLQNLASVMKQQGLEELVIQPGEESRYGEMFKIPVYIRCQGKLVHIFKFFKALEGFERIVQIKEVVMTGSDKLDGTLIMQAKVDIFYRNK